MRGRRFRRRATARSIDDSAAKTVKGYFSSLALEDPSDTVPGWVMVFANSYQAAIRAAHLVKVDWVGGDGANVSERDILDYGAKQIADPKGGVLLWTTRGSTRRSGARVLPSNDPIRRAVFSTLSSSR